MFLHLSVRHSVHGGLPQCMLGYTPPGQEADTPTNGTPSNDETVSAQTEHVTATDGTTVETVETCKIDTENSSATLLPEVEHANEWTLSADEIIEKVMGKFLILNIVMNSNRIRPSETYPLTYQACNPLKL